MAARARFDREDTRVSKVLEHADGKTKLPSGFPYSDHTAGGDWQLAPLEIYNRSSTFSGTDLLRDDGSTRSQPIQCRPPQAMSACKFGLRYESRRSLIPLTEKLFINKSTTPMMDTERYELFFEEPHIRSN